MTLNTVMTTDACHLRYLSFLLLVDDDDDDDEFKHYVTAE